MTSERKGHPSIENAELLAVSALSFLASNQEALSRFLALTGIGPPMLRAAAAEPTFLAGVLDFFLADERLLVAYADHAAIPASRVAEARRALDNGN